MIILTEKNLSKISSIYSGFAFKSSDLQKNSGIPIIKIANIQNRMVSSNCIDYLSDFLYAKKLDQFVLHKNDILIAMTGAGSVGKVGKMRCILKKFLINQRVAIIRITSSSFDPEYVYQVLSNGEYEKILYQIGLGAGQPNISPSDIGGLKIPQPPFPIQQKIAAILAVYDDLIDINTRRIRILEEMAQAIYREWFVNLRFPGYAGVQMVESELGRMPEGWEVKRLDEVAKVIDCLHGIKPTEVTNDKQKFGILLHVWNIGEEGKLELSKKFFITEEVYRLWTKRIEVKAGDCIITNVGRIGAFAQIPFDLKAAIGRNMTAIRCREGIITPTYLIEYLRSPYFDREKNLKQDSGTVMGSLNVKGIVRLTIPIPSFNLVKEFEMIVRPFRYRIEIFQKQNDNLRCTRDLLLPKLISGETDVSELDIRIPEAEA